MAEEQESAADEAAAELAELGMEEKVEEAATSSAAGAAEGGKSSEGSDAGDNGTPANGDRREQPVASQRLVRYWCSSTRRLGAVARFTQPWQYSPGGNAPSTEASA